MAKQGQILPESSTSKSIDGTAEPPEPLFTWPQRKKRAAGGDLLTRLQLENAELRERAVELALQIQAFRDGSSGTLTH